uniref:HTH_48 domain-containing protein n=1 Tax=Heterorhabditis bacteriophora TaxID=37862 RepID=A0A1I7WMA3_HETBA
MRSLVNIMLIKFMMKKLNATVGRTQLLTYEMAQKPHHIGVRKSWLTWHSQNLEGPLMVAQDEIIRRFIRGFFPLNVVVDGNEL